jgi:hypothetical protein
MGISVKRRETVEVVRQLAEAKHIGLTDAIHQAAERELESLGVVASRSEQRAAELEAWLKEVDARPRKDPRPWREIEAEMYDDFGNPK